MIKIKSSKGLPDNPELETEQNVFGEKIKRLRLERNFTINELADITNLIRSILLILKRAKKDPNGIQLSN